MFISKRRPITISQAEHQKLAGTLAMLWGNDQFGLPPVPFESFHTGIALHDRAYGALDNLPIGAISESEWIALTWRGFDMTWDDALADLIAKRHLQRLMSYGNSEERQQGEILHSPNLRFCRLPRCQLRCGFVPSPAIS